MTAGSLLTGVTYLLRLLRVIWDCTTGSHRSGIWDGTHLSYFSGPGVSNESEDCGHGNELGDGRGLRGPTGYSTRSRLCLKRSWGSVGNVRTGLVAVIAASVLMLLLHALLLLRERRG